MFVAEAGEIDFEDVDDEEEVEDRDGDVGTWNLRNFVNLLQTCNWGEYCHLHLYKAFAFSTTLPFIEYILHHP